MQERSIRNHAIIGNGHTAALVAREGTIDWFCAPRFDSDALFCALLDDRRGGSFELSPLENASAATRRYLPGTNVLETTFSTGRGTARVVDSLGGDGRETWIVRRVEGVAGEVEFVSSVTPAFSFARVTADMELTGDGGVARAPGSALRVVAPGRGERASAGFAHRFRVRAGERRFVWLGHALEAQPPPAPEDDTLLRHQREAIRADRAWSARCTYDGPHTELVQRSALALRALLHRPTGGLVAAPTTSLPECIGGERNWDYRYVWSRDAAWLVEGLMGLGYHDEAMGFWAWLQRHALGAGGPLAPVRTVTGELPPPELTLGHLAGHRGSAPVRVGNGARGQLQLDGPGEILRAIDVCVSSMPSMTPLEDGLCALVHDLAEECATRWREPDAGLWERRDSVALHTSSLVTCWQGLDRAIRVMERDGRRAPLARWARERDRIRATVVDEHYAAQAGDGGSFVRSPGSDAIDASALFVALSGMLAPDDARVLATIRSVRAVLGDGGLVRRYLGRDGLDGQEGAFLLCSFWLSDALVLAGRHDEAEGVFERAAACANDVGLLAEQADPRTGELLGNFPQALSHLGLVRSARLLHGAAPATRP